MVGLDLDPALPALPRVLVLDEINAPTASHVGEAFSELASDKRGTPIQLSGYDDTDSPLQLRLPEDL